MKPTAKQVAHVAGVSLSAVSRAFTPGAPLLEAKRKRILTIASEIGYTSPARRTAEAIASGTVTLVAGDLSNPFYPMALQALAKQLQLSDRQLLVYALPDQAEVDLVTSKIIAARPNAVVVMSARLNSDMAKACQQHGIMVVMLNRIQRDIRVAAVTCDNYTGGRDAAQYLLAKGRRRIGFLGGIPNTSTHGERAAGFRDRLKEAGQTIHSQASGNFDYRTAYRAAMSLFSQAAPPDALFCCNDVMGLAAIDAAKDRGIAIPHQVSIIGFDDIPMAAWPSYRLTTIRQPIERMIHETLGIIADEDGTGRTREIVRTLPGKLIIRSSA